VATTLNEISQQSKVGMRIEENQLPIHPAVHAACELLGLDPLYVANEGKLICICAEENAPTLLELMRSDPLGREAAIIGEVTKDPNSFVEMNTTLGGSRIIDWLVGEQLPRIC